MRTRLIASCLTAGAAFGAALLPTAATAAPAVRETPSAQAICIPEARVCGGIGGNATRGFDYEFTIRQPPSSLSFSFTVNGVRSTGSLSSISRPDLFQGWFTPRPSLIQGDLVCMTVSSIPGTYCDTAR